MTVIVYKKPYMAADSRVSDEEDSSIFTNKYRKLHQLKDGSVLGIAGDADYRAILEFFNKLKGNKLPSNKQLISIGQDFDALWVRLDQKVYFIAVGKKSKNDEWSAQVLEVNDPFACIGTGAKYATGAMDMGATPERAVKTAIKFDPSCGGTVLVLKLEFNE